MKKFYLAHNFNTRKTIRKWELKMEGKYNIKLSNPFYDNPYRARDMKMVDSFIDGSKEQLEYLATRNNSDIVEDDLDLIRKSDGILAFAQDIRVGTPMEIFFASRILRIPVYIITKRYATHPWIMELATKVFTNQREFEKYAKEKWGMKK